MARKKLCPNCRKLNLPSLVECEFCGWDIGSVKSKEESLLLKQEQERLEQEKKPPQEAEPQSEQEDLLPEPTLPPKTSAMGEVVAEEFIVCEECGHKNATNQRKCTKCGASLVGLEISRETKIQRFLVSLDGLFRLELTEEEVVIGRQGAGGDYLEKQDKTYVGRRHAKITNLPDGVFLEDLMSRNGTYVNGILVEPGMVKPLCSSDIIGLGGAALNQKNVAYFRIEK